MKSGTLLGLTGLPEGNCSSLSINWGIVRLSGMSGRGTEERNKVMVAVQGRVMDQLYMKWPS